MNRVRLSWWAVVLVTWMLTGCSVVSFFSKSKPAAGLESIRVVADPRANAYTATALDLVFVYDASALAALPKTGPAWFGAKTGLMSAYPRALDVVSLQVPPPYTLDVTLPKRHAEAIRVLAFANYIPDAGQYPIDLTALKHALVRLESTGIDVSDGKGA